jgi:hypothetical protein
MATAKTRTSLIYEGPAFQRAAELSRRVADYEAAAESAQGRLENLKARRGALADRLAELDARRPVIGDGIDSSLVDALVADPSAQPDPASIASRADDHIAVMTRWETDKEVVTQAIARIDAEIEAAEGDFDARSGPGGEAFREFVEASHEALLKTFLAEIERLRVEYVVPMLIMTRLYTNGKVENSSAAHRLIIGASQVQLCDDSEITTVWSGPSGRGTNDHLKAGRFGPDERRMAPERLQAFRDELAKLAQGGAG